MSPAREKDPEPPVKSIPRPPREKFPEDPAPVREGRAAQGCREEGHSTNARWTKIDRKLVNPEALEEGNERYEERIDYVIVLRVLTKEEIQNYALRTQEIRGKREQICIDGVGTDLPAIDARYLWSGKRTKDSDLESQSVIGSLKL
jgi:hypothetical protein